MATEVASPPLSPTSSTSSGTKRRRSNLSLDLSDLPALSQPTPPSNTLLITNLNTPETFTTQNLAVIRDAINSHAPLHSFAPLKSFRRIVVSFHSIADATEIRSLLDGSTILQNRIRVYFGQPTAITQPDQHLHAPQSQKLFFISPPPSPPHGWISRNEDPPNKAVHADDLASALAKLHAKNTQDYVVGIAGQHVPTSHGTTNNTSHGNGEPGGPGGMNTRSRSSTVVFDPVDQGHSPDLPAIAVEDTGDEFEPSPMETESPMPFLHTARPPVELME